jgi:anti-sigma B factor antagonist
VAVLELSSARHGDRTVVAVKGELDIVSRNQFIAHVDGVIRDNGNKIIIDFSGLSFIDTSALSTVVSYWKRLSSEEGGLLALAGAEYTNARVLWITGLAKRLPMYDDVDAALAAI